MITPFFYEHTPTNIEPNNRENNPTHFITFLVHSFQQWLILVAWKIHYHHFRIRLHSCERLVHNFYLSKEVVYTYSSYDSSSLYFEIVTWHTVEYFPSTFSYTKCTLDHISAGRIFEVKFLPCIAKVSSTAHVPIIELLEMVQYIGSLIWSHVLRSVGESRIDKVIFSRSRM